MRLPNRRDVDVVSTNRSLGRHSFPRSLRVCGCCWFEIAVIVREYSMPDSPSWWRWCHIYHHRRALTRILLLRVSCSLALPSLCNCANVRIVRDCCWHCSCGCFSLTLMCGCLTLTGGPNWPTGAGGALPTNAAAPSVGTSIVSVGVMYATSSGSGATDSSTSVAPALTLLSPLQVRLLCHRKQRQALLPHPLPWL